VSITPTQLTLRHLRANGYTAEVVEHWNSHARIRQDLFGIIDVLALCGAETVAVQTTTAANVPARIRKIVDSPNIDAMHQAGWTVRVHGWAKVKNRWVLKRDEVIS
jgi:aspartate/glutamate racemase